MKAQLFTQRLFLLLVLSSTLTSCQEDQFFQKELAVSGSIDIPNGGGPVVDGGSTTNPENPSTELPTNPTNPTIPPTNDGGGNPTDGGGTNEPPQDPLPPIVIVPKNCGEVSHLEFNSRTRFQTSNVAFGQTCTSELQLAQCVDGEFAEWSGTYQYSACTINAPADCGSVKHGEKVTRVMYSSNSVAYGSSCQMQTQSRTCNNGSFGSWSGDYAYDSCTVQSPQVKQVTESFVQNSAKQGKVDILWMVDNSGSMGDEQRALAENFDRFISNFLREGVDFKMGITTTDIRSSYSGVSRCAFDKLTATAAASNELLFINDFKSCIKVGTNGYSVEAGLTTTRDFLKRYSTNFLRSEAYLIVVMISDEPEQSRETVESLVSQIKGYKSNTGLLKIYSIVPSNIRISERYLKATQLTGGKTGDITGNFAEILKEMGDKIVDLSSSFALKSLPYDNQIVVTVNGKIVETGWSIDTQSGTLKFDSDATPAEGATITIKYNARIQ